MGKRSRPTEDPDLKPGDPNIMPPCRPDCPVCNAQPQDPPPLFGRSEGVPESPGPERHLLRGRVSWGGEEPR